MIPAPEPDSCSAGTVPHPVPRPLPRTMPQPRTRHPLFSYLGVPVTTGMSDWYENNTRPPCHVVPSPEGPGAGSPRPCQQATPFSYLGVPVTTGMSDWYENGTAHPHTVVPAPRREPIPGRCHGLCCNREPGAHFSSLGVPVATGMYGYREEPVPEQSETRI